MSNLETNEVTVDALRDPLTGAYSSTCFKTRFNEEMRVAETLGSDLTVCVLDLDYLDRINEGYGYLRGNQVLQEFVRKIKSIVRGDDLLYRYRGDEFVFLLPGAKKEKVQRMARRIVKQIKGHQFSGEPPLFLSLKVRVASFPQDAKTPGTLFEKADPILQQPSRSGLVQAFKRMPKNNRLITGRIEDNLECSNVSNKSNDQMPPNNLATPLTEFVGRESEIQSINMLLDQFRLVTLTGPGGIGKTRLSLMVGRMRLNRYPDGVFQIALAKIDRPQQVIPCIAEALGIAETDCQINLNAIKRILRNKNMLLILDNFEHIIEAAPVLAEILTSAPGVKALVTSREALCLSGEHRVELPPFEIPEVANTSIESLAQQPAVALFMLCAKAVRYDFKLSESNVEIIAMICRQLDGIPLAIELAAAQIGSLTLGEMVKLSRKNLLWLDKGARDLPPRQQTLWKTMEWSYQLLNDTEQALFNRLSVFSDGFTCIAAQAVYGSERDSVGQMENRLNSLIAKSLIKRVEPAAIREDARYFMLETLREFASEKLENLGEASEYKRRQAEYYVYLAEKTEEHIQEADRKIWLNRLEREHANLRAVLEWAQSQEESEILSRLTVALGPFWELRGFWDEGRLFLENVIKLYPKSLSTERRIKLYLWAGRLAHLTGDLETARCMLQTGLEISLESEDLREMARLLCELSRVANYRWDFEGMKRYSERSLALYETLGDEAGIAMVHRELGRALYSQADYGQAEELLMKSLTYCRKQEDPFGVMECLNELGKIVRAFGDYQRAADLFQENLCICEMLENRAGMIDSLTNLAELARSRGDYRKAEDYYKKLLELCQNVGNKSGVARALKDLGEISRLQGDGKRAMELYGESLALSMENGNQNEIVWIYRNMGEVVLTLGDYSSGKVLFRKALEIFGPKTDKLLMSVVLPGLSHVALMLGDTTKAARLLGATRRIMALTGLLVAEGDRLLYDQRQSFLQEVMGVDRFDQAFTEGEEMTDEEAVEYALTEN